MNTIPEKQSEPQSLDLLFVQRALYSSAKRLFLWRIRFALLIAIGGPVVTVLQPNSGAYVGLCAIGFLLLDSLILEVIESKKRLQAAKVQELFDTHVLNLPWHSLVAGKRLDPEILGDVLNSFPTKDYSKLRDWYSPAVGKIDLTYAQLLCQRSNVWWDTHLRERYSTAIVVCMIVAISITVLLSLLLDLTVSLLISGLIVPLLPVLEVAIKQNKDNRESSSATHEMQASIDESIDRLFQGENLSNPEAVVRRYQDAIFRHRVKCPMIPDWVYYLLRDRQEKQMQFAVEKKVEECLARKNV